MNRTNHHEQLFDAEAYRVIVDEVEARDMAIIGLDKWLHYKGYTTEAHEIACEILDFVRERNSNAE